jgi:exonuclease SbcC
MASLPEFHLDLERGLLAEAGVFAITGPTGAGKSTLLDTLCLALFDRAPRFESRSRSTTREGLTESDPRNCLRRGAAQGLAEVVFRGREGYVYKATWSVKRAYLKPDGRLGASTLAFENLTKAVNLTGAGKKETLETIERALGLGFEQFCRSVLLAQGEFAQFLRSAPNEKAQLLENLTGTGVFGEISKTAFRIARAHALEVKALETEAAALEASLGEWGAGDAFEACEKGGLDVHVKAVQDALDAHEFQLSALDAQRQKDEITLAKIENRHALVVREAGLRAELAMLDGRQRTAQEALLCANTALSTAKSELDLQEKEHSLHRAVAEEAKGLEAALAACESTRTRLASEARRLADDAARARAEEATLASLAEFVSSPSLEGSLAAGAHAAGANVESASAHPLLTPLVTAAQKRRRQAALLAQAEESGLRLRETCERAGASPSALAKPAEGARLLLEERESLESLLKGLDSAHDALHKARESRLARSIAIHASAQEEARAVEGERALLGARDALARAEADWSIALQHDDIRARRGLLKKGAPCPLCGALEHPAVDHPISHKNDHGAESSESHGTPQASLTALLDKERVAAARRVEDLSRATAAARAQLPSLQKEQDFQASQEAVAKAALARVLEQTTQTSPACPEPFKEQALAYVRACAERVGQEGEIVGSPCDVRPGVRTRLAEVNALLPLLSALQESRATYQERKTALKDDERHVAETAAAVRDQAMAARQVALRTAAFAAEELARCALERTHLEKETESLREARARLPADAPLAFQSAEARLLKAKRVLAEAQDVSLAAAATAANLEGTREEKQRALASLVHDIQEAALDDSERGFGHGSPESLQTSPEALAAGLQSQAHALRAHLDSTRERARALSVECGRLAAKRDALAEGQHRLALLGEKLFGAREKSARWEALSSVIGSADGALFRRKAQSITLAFLVEGTNDTLERLCPRYRLLRTEGGELDLLVSDTWMDGAPRSVSTLSGGETFLISLALALGLSHLSSRHVFLGTLFVDEGFGTLDPVTLETTLAMFDALQSDGRQVGLISHVTGLAERLGARVVVTPQGQGASVLTVED